VVDEIANKVSKSKKMFLGMNTKEKLQRRQQEVNELDKRLEQFENQVNEIEVDMQSEFNKINIGAEDGERLHTIFEEMLSEI